MSSVLSQAEIDALLTDAFPGGSEAQSQESMPDIDDLTYTERDALGEIANISMGTSATTLSSLLGKKVEITTPQIEITSVDSLRTKYPKPYVIVDVNYAQGLMGSNVFIIHTYDAGVIVDLMMGGDGSNPPMELNDLHLSAISEAMNQMMGSACTSLSQILSKRIDISPPTLDLLQLTERQILGSDSEPVIRIAFRVVIQGLIDSEMMQLLPLGFAREMVNEVLKKSGGEEANPPTTQKRDKQTEAPPKATKQEKQKPPENTVYESAPQQEPQHFAYQQPLPRQSEPPQPQISVSPVQFDSLEAESEQALINPNLDLILDVGLNLSVELGRTTKRIKDILELAIGSIVELDKLAGEPVDVLVNGRLLAKGEVVVIDENFGVRVTEIIAPAERVKNLK